ncbi:MAG: RrF2 family transcriptional regulator [Planctomycetota bacterium]
MLTKTSISAIRMVLHLALRGDPSPVSPREIAARLGESPTYLAKVAGHLVRAGILRARRGVLGGVELRLAPAQISLLAIVEACQGAILGDFCADDDADMDGVCSFHRAGVELFRAVVGVLGRWKLADLLGNPCASSRRPGSRRCWLEPLGVPSGRGGSRRRGSRRRGSRHGDTPRRPESRP